MVDFSLSENKTEFVVSLPRVTTVKDTYWFHESRIVLNKDISIVTRGSEVEAFELDITWFKADNMPAELFAETCRFKS